MFIGNVQRFCLHDGPGIRTVVFSMGCDLRCPWCCNPENFTHSIKQGKKHMYGVEMSDDDLVSILLKDENYYKNGGGVTFSGGEFLLHVEEYEEVLKRLKSRGISICIETSLFASIQNFEKAIEYCDLFIIDFKIMNNEKAKTILNADVSKFYNNFKLLENKNYWARIPLSKEITDKENIKEIKKLFKINKPSKVELLTIHDLGRSKYEDLSLEYSYTSNMLEDHEIEEIMAQLKDYNPSILNI